MYIYRPRLSLYMERADMKKYIDDQQTQIAKMQASLDAHFAEIEELFEEYLKERYGEK